MLSVAFCGIAALTTIPYGTALACEALRDVALYNSFPHVVPVLTRRGVFDIGFIALAVVGWRAIVLVVRSGVRRSLHRNVVEGALLISAWTVWLVSALLFRAL